MGMLLLFFYGNLISSDFHYFKLIILVHYDYFRLYFGVYIAYIGSFAFDKLK